VLADEIANGMLHDLCTTRHAQQFGVHDGTRLARITEDDYL